jgi:phage shock protein C
MTQRVLTDEYHKLRRQNGVLAGVCGGLGVFFGIRPLWFRILFLILLLPGGLPGLVPYLILWLIIPKRRIGLN